MPDLATYEGRCPNPGCKSAQWVSVSLDGGRTRIPQCVPCGAYHRGVVLGHRNVAEDPCLCRKGGDTGEDCPWKCPPHRPSGRPVERPS